MMPLHRLIIFCFALSGLVSVAPAQPAPAKPQPDSRFGNWLYRSPDPKIWKVSEQNGARIFSVDEPPGDFCTLTLFAGGTAEADFGAQFAQAVAADQKAKDTVTIEADSGAKAGKSAEGYDTLTRSLRSVTTALHTYHVYVAGHSGDRFELAAFQTSSAGSWKQYGAQAAQFILSLKLADSVAAPEAPPSLPGLDDAPAGPTTPLAVSAPNPSPATPPSPTPAPAAAPVQIPDRPLDKSPLVVNHAVSARNGKPVDPIKLSQHDLEISNPSIALAPNGTIHVAFIEKHRTTYAAAVYHRSSADHGKTWTEAKNLSEDMPGYLVGKCEVLADRSGLIYVIWRAGMAVNFPASPNAGGAGPSNLMYRVLENGHWSRIKPVHPPGNSDTQDQGSRSYFATTDAAGRAQVIWNVAPSFWHQELTKVSGTYRQSLPGVGPGLVFQATLNGANPGQPHEVYLTPVAGQNEQGGYGTYCDGLDALNGYCDADGAPHFIAALSRNHDSSLRGKSVFQLIENGKGGPLLELPDLSYHGWNDIPRLLVDAAGKRHIVVMYPAGEHPSVRDYRVGSDDEPTIIRATTGVKGTLDGFQAFQGPNGRMVALMQFNDSGDRASGDTFVSISDGGPWSVPVNVTNNTGRKSFAYRQIKALSTSIQKSVYPGPAAGAFDADGHLLLLMVNYEYGLFGSDALGITLTSGSSSTPTLQFLRL